MDTLRLQIENIKNIQTADLLLPFDNDIYSFVGANGCGKSTIMLCLAQLIKLQLNSLSDGDYSQNSFVRFEYNEKSSK